MTPRELALKLLIEWEENDKYANLSLQSPAFSSMSEQDKAFVTTLFYTTVERKITLDYLIGAFTDGAAARLSVHTRAVLRLGLSQVLFHDRIPSFAAVSATVDLCTNVGERRLVNAVLRRAVRERGALPFPSRDKNEARYLSIVYSFPLPLVRYFLSCYGEQTEALLSAFNGVAPLTVTVNTCRTTREALIERFRAVGLSAEPAGPSPLGVRIAGDAVVSRLPGYREGHFFVQDEASRSACAVLAPRSGERIIDVCAAPGGKSFCAAIAAGDGAEVLSFDVHESKCSLIRDGARRLGLSSIRVSARDATVPDTALLGTADRVICDAPCSGLGVLGKKPDLRYKDTESWKRLPPLALSILTESARYVKAGGVLVYSTCTLNEAENRAVVDAFLREHADFYLSPFAVGTHDGADGTLTLLPHRDQTDGFYIAKLCRRMDGNEHKDAL